MEEEAAPDAAAEAKAEVGTDVKAEAGMEPKAEAAAVEGGVDGAALETDEVGGCAHHACTHHLQLPCLWSLGIYMASHTSHVIDKQHVATS